MGNELRTRERQVLHQVWLQVIEIEHSHTFHCREATQVRVDCEWHKHSYIEANFLYNIIFIHYTILYTVELEHLEEMQNVFHVVTNKKNSKDSRHMGVALAAGCSSTWTTSKCWIY